jgi:SAM-dependent methyltransferase
LALCEPTAFDVICPASVERFDEAGYLAANPDVAAAVKSGAVQSGRVHFMRFGRGERRLMYRLAQLQPMQQEKLQRIQPVLDLSLAHVRCGDKYDFLSQELREATAIENTANESRNPYDPDTITLIHRHKDGLVLDCGAGSRPTYYSNVVNLEIVDYPTTDVIAVNERLPFKDASFDAVISIVVLEHVRDPFRSAAEIVRVLKPGGELLCCVPFLQPEHGYPHHYYNMAPQGLRALFDRMLTIDDHRVVPSTLPVWSLTWFVRSWAAGLTGQAREDFLSLRLADLLVDTPKLLDRPWVRQLPPKKNFELASATVLFAHKPR